MYITTMALWVLNACFLDQGQLVRGVDKDGTDMLEVYKLRLVCYRGRVSKALNRRGNERHL